MMGPDSMMENQVCALQISEPVLIDLERVKPHEEVDSEYLDELLEEIVFDGMLKLAIAVDRDTNIILDGNHRYNVLRRLGARKIPAVLVDYHSTCITAESWNGQRITKDTVVQAGLSGHKLPPKTSKHMVRIDGELSHISAFERIVNYPLKDL
jgi:hypothetical protein